MKCKTYEVLEWPAVQGYMDIPDFSEHAYSIDSYEGVQNFGPNAYFVESLWLEKADEILYEHKCKKS